MDDRSLKSQTSRQSPLDATHTLERERERGHATRAHASRSPAPLTLLESHSRLSCLAARGEHSTHTRPRARPAPRAPQHLPKRRVWCLVLSVFSLGLRSTAPSPVAAHAREGLLLSTSSRRLSPPLSATVSLSLSQPRSGASPPPLLASLAQSTDGRIASSRTLALPRRALDGRQESRGRQVAAQPRSRSVALSPPLALRTHRAPRTRGHLPPPPPPGSCSLPRRATYRMLTGPRPHRAAGRRRRSAARAHTARQCSGR
jgi:hypothetical protein